MVFKEVPAGLPVRMVVPYARMFEAGLEAQCAKRVRVERKPLQRLELTAFDVQAQVVDEGGRVDFGQERTQRPRREQAAPRRPAVGVELVIRKRGFGTLTLMV